MLLTKLSEVNTYIIQNETKSVLIDFTALPSNYIFFQPQCVHFLSLQALAFEAIIQLPSLCPSLLICTMRRGDSMIVELSFIYTSFVVIIYCSVAKSCPTYCDPMDCSMLGFLVLHYLPEFAQIHVHGVSDAI